MKKLFQHAIAMLFFISSIFQATTLLAQIPNKMSFQAVIRNSSSNLLKSAPVSMRISILYPDTSTIVYQETQSTITNVNGLASIQIGGGVVVSGSMEWIPCCIPIKGPPMLRIEIDPTGGTNYTINSTTELLSAPFASRSKYSDTSIVSRSDNNQWHLNGNSNLTSAHYIGTPIGTNQPMKFKVNGTTSAWIDWDQNIANTLFGYNAGSSISTNAAYNTAFGNNALSVNTSGSNNTALGYGANLSFSGQNNSTAIGANAIVSKNNSMVLGNNNVNVGIGLSSDTSGPGNKLEINAGPGFVFSQHSGGGASGLKFRQLTTSTIPINNPGNGVLSVDAIGNVIYVNKNDTSGIKSWSLNGNSNLTSSHYIGTPIGTNTPMRLKVNGMIAGQIDWDQTLANTLFGFTGSAISISGAYNTAVGNYALPANTGGTRNVAIGHYAMNANTIGSNNSAVGKFTLPVNIIGNENTAFGANAMDQSMTGNQNVAIGVMALHTNVSGSYNTVIGYAADIDSNSRNNATAIGNGAVARGSNTMVFGNNYVLSWGFGTTGTPILGRALIVGTTSANGNGAFLTTGGVWTNASDSTKKHDVKNLSYGLKDIMKMNPVSYKMNGSNYQDIGFVAQEMRLVIPEIVYGEEGSMTLSYGQLTSVLVKAMQEQQKMIEQLKADNAKLKSDVAEIKEILDQGNKVEAKNKN